MAMLAIIFDKKNCDLLIFTLILEKETRKSQCYVVYIKMFFTRISSTLQGGW